MVNIKKVSIVIPVYNEEAFIEQTIDAVLRADSLKLQKEIVIVDDGSTDSTPQIIRSQALKHKFPDDKVIYKKMNEGKGAALRDGFKVTTGDVVIVQDADVEYSPDDYPALLNPFVLQRADVVYGSRFVSGKPHRVLYFWHYVGVLFLTSLSNLLTGLNLTDMESGYKAFSGRLIRNLAPYLQSRSFDFEPEITARISKITGIRIYEVGISYWGRTYREGKKLTWKDGFSALWSIIKYNVLTHHHIKTL